MLVNAAFVAKLRAMAATGIRRQRTWSGRRAPADYRSRRPGGAKVKHYGAWRIGCDLLNEI